VTGDSERTRRLILDAAERLLQRTGGATIDDVARDAQCAKGLVHYHFRTKDQLMAAVVADTFERRRRRWTDALQADTPQEAIEHSWQLLIDEHSSGVTRLWIVLGALEGRATVRSVSSETKSFSATITEASKALLSGLGLEPTIPAEEVGFYLASVIHGAGFQLQAGVSPDELQGPYAAAWLGVLSLTRASADSTAREKRR
jgi:AcrR family transcriptional regulator